MGQLEKYGLYVLCLVVFLILGVTIWGGDEVSPVRRAPVAAPIRAEHNASASDAPRALASIAETIMLQPAAESSRPAIVEAGTNGRVDNVAVVDAPAPAPAPAPAAVPAVYVVQDGDTFGSIAKAKLGKESRWTEIQRLNPAVQPSKLRKGQELKLPTAAPAEPKKKLDAPLPLPADGTRTYVVAKGDNYERIAVNQLGSRKRTAELIAANPGVSPEKLRPGMTIKLPKK
ncbi:MAG: LysM peptidoglycan-binding domain-containing protein [Planctomycetota bacterium]|jgi:LysM repeat protein